MKKSELLTIIKEEIASVINESPKGSTAAAAYWSKKDLSVDNKMLAQHIGKKVKISSDQGGGTGILIAVGKDNGEDISIIKMSNNSLHSFSTDYIYSLIQTSMGSY